MEQISDAHYRDGDDYFYFKSLALRVLTVLFVNHKQKIWMVWIDGVAGKDHHNEWNQVVSRGSKLEKEIAYLIYPRSKDWMNYEYSEE